MIEWDLSLSCTETICDFVRFKYKAQYTLKSVNCVIVI